ncbi:glycosyltransferase [Liquorilactobacillus nagelii]|uniref:glycosyltransferase n=1 Tax=Liquorilactobacillus nagelii TaxID=82688 RepID=UPI0006EEF88D|nr:glycosyltransferase [Liquorilactobacillus nagelii]KRL41527.1 hypothetical protein FD45_GL001048 [Liquorilactobacillus nagelii DSM 13675]QYH54142.1 glycosyltransferase family 4 protein [Liquorilactobacillus nagelii DSM 13675]
MLKVLMVCESFGGGVFAYVSQLCNDMCEYDDFEIYLAYSVRPQTPKDFKSKLNKKIHLIEVKSFYSYKSLTGFFKTVKELRNIEEKIKPDIIHLHSSIAGGFGRIAFSGKTNKVVYTPHGYAHILMGRNKKTIFFEIMERVLGKRNATTLTCCESEDEVAKTFSTQTAYIETGININDLSKKVKKIVSSDKKKEFTVFTLGRISFQKQPKLFNEIAKLVPEANFVWIGDGELRDELDAPNIKITGWKDREEALSLAYSADVYILCSLGEAIAMSLVENMYLRKLCLVSNVMGNKSVIKNNVNGYICNDASEYAKRIKESMNNFPGKLVEQAYKDVLNVYNTETMKKKYVEFYKSLVK